MTQLSTTLKEDDLQTVKDFTGKVFKMENHDEAYYIWKEANVKQRILIHIDAHNDMWWIEKDPMITIANFICPALKEDLVKEMFWVVPDKTWETAKTREKILRHLKEISKSYPGGPHPVKVRKEQISTVVLGKPFTVCSLSSLPRINESVLLDIDIDYLVIPYVSYRENDKHTDLPWCWPDELLTRLNERNVSSDLITIAYSVEGGYTPLKWKYLGDELAARLKNDSASKSFLRGMELIKEGSILTQMGNLDSAEKKYHEAVNLLPNSAAPSYHLAELYAKKDQKSDAQQFYKQVLSMDPTYRTAYNNAGPIHYSNKNFLEAEKEYRKILLLDPQDAYAYFGLGQIAYFKKKWDESEALLKKSLELNEHLTDAYRALADIYVKQKQYEKAIVFYERSIKLALEGYKPLNDASIFTCTGNNHKKDLDHCRIHAKLASLYAKKGNITEAINGYRISIAGKFDGPFIRFHLANLYMKQKKWKKAFQVMLACK